MNRAVRRKQAMAVANDLIKGRQQFIEKAKADPQKGFAFVFTNKLFLLTLWSKTWVFYDRRAR